MISIHAPAKGATRLPCNSLWLISISIHAPAKGATPCCCLLLPVLRFQSTLPRRERQERDCADRLLSAISIHAPAKGATKHIVDIALFCVISIHAPAKGATDRVRKLFVSMIISIHAPAKGATSFELPHIILVVDFNPRSREGSDDFDNACNSKPLEFQSTLPRRERRTFHL